MILKYVGKNPSCVVIMENKDGGMGVNVNHGETFDCPPHIAADLMARFNVDPLKPFFIEADQKERKERKQRIPEKNKMMDSEEIKEI